MKNKLFLSIFIAFLGVVLAITGCCPCKPIKIKCDCCCFDGRRPQVMRRCPNMVIDYTPDCCCCCDGSATPVGEPLANTTPPHLLPGESVLPDGCPIIGHGIGWDEKDGPDPNRPPFLAFDNPCTMSRNACCQEPEEPSCCDIPACCAQNCRMNKNKTPIVDVSYEMLNPRRETAQEYRLSIGDILEISVFGDEEAFADRVIIAPDGKIYYAFLEGIEAAGRTIPELSEAIALEIGHLFLSPSVSIIPRTSVNNKFKILGRVQMPGVYPIIGTMRVRDAIGQAGGLLLEVARDKDKNSDLLTLADLNASFMIRDKKIIKVDFYKLLLAGDDSQNIVLQPGDYIYIAATRPMEVFVLGGVVAPQSMIYSRNLTLMSAIASAGGWTSGFPYSADYHQVILLRGNLDCPCVAYIDLCKILNGEARDLYLQPGDIIFVANKTMRLGREVVRLAIATFLESFTTAAASYYAGSKWFPISNGNNTNTTNTTNGTTNGTN